MTSTLLAILAHALIVIGSSMHVHASHTGRHNKLCPGTQTAAPEECCNWLGIRDVVQANILGGGKCGQEAQVAIRLTFHDAIGLSIALKSSGKPGGGGADGSIMKYHTVELAYPASRGLGNITYALKDVADNHNVSYGDIIQFAGAVALSNCPGSPRLQFLAGRPEAQSASPPNLVPPPSGSVDSILSRMADAGFTADDTVALLAAHSVGRQEVTDLTVPGMPLDSTPGRFDGQFYLEVLLKAKNYPGGGQNKTMQAKSAFSDQFRLASDAAIARAPITAYRQSQLTSAFRNAMIKLANNGQDVGKLIDCSDAIPIPEFWNGPTVLPQGKTLEDLDHPCSEQPFPEIFTAR